MADPITVQCAIVGGGPAGMMLGVLLARAGVTVAVLEKHADFFRDFRGDTIHPSTLEVMHELGVLEDFLTLPHFKARTLSGKIGTSSFTMADFSHLPTKCSFVAMMPQWDFLNFLAEFSKTFPTFQLFMGWSATALIESKKRVTGLLAQTPTGEQTILADLVVACDGRHSTLRKLCDMKTQDLGAPMDVLWFRISRKASDAQEIFGRFESGQVFVQINRGDVWQCGLVIAKGSFETLKAQGLDAFRQRIRSLTDDLDDRVSEISSWDDVKLLSVTVDRLTEWHRDGLLFIGDSAHAMSPVGGVGINLALQDAVASANLLAERLREGTLSRADLALVQQRRMFPVTVTQAIQLAIQNRIIGAALDAQEPLKIPFALKLLNWFPWLRRLPARLIGLGVRPEHVRSPLFRGEPRK